ncbi:hypothetical protein KC19_3G047700 [Ceratodon purpureus]|uniref:Uncharacterized protein n=1 Tax=Ceratodon purpureus TaxID=3225 RepID=A0A8T0IH85_CERPU|nr:hypothetical protein KC19_3G047700 [Ceratodon purpureus]
MSSGDQSLNDGAGRESSVTDQRELSSVTDERAESSDVDSTMLWLMSSDGEKVCLPMPVADFVAGMTTEVLYKFKNVSAFNIHLIHVSLGLNHIKDNHVYWIIMISKQEVSAAGAGEGAWYHGGAPENHRQGDFQSLWTALEGIHVAEVPSLLTVSNH